MAQALRLAGGPQMRPAGVVHMFWCACVLICSSLQGTWSDRQTLIMRLVFFCLLQTW
jgi:hypothetical protein